MIPCLDKTRDGRPVNFQLDEDPRGLRVTVQEGGDSRTNVLSRLDAIEAIKDAIRSLTPEDSHTAVNERHHWLMIGFLANEIARPLQERVA
ncbi:MAG: hypothetical protein KGL39_32385 [Patescibacteria group bacterium]|nr:hypothetical protein [Patescibacteria group bacterium]